MTVMELPNFLGMVLVLLCFGLMVLLILRSTEVLGMHGDDIVFHSSLNQVPSRIPKMNMMKVHIPFTFKLMETSKSTYSEIQYSISSQVEYRILVYWGVNIREFHTCLWQPWSIIRDMCLNDTLLVGSYLLSGLDIRKSRHSEESMKLNLTLPLDLGTPPRTRYPLVIFLMRVDKEDNIHPDETVALINVVHIKDSVCPLPTSVLAQYLKQANGRLSCLKQLYLAAGSGSTGSYDEPIAVAETVDEGIEGIDRPLDCSSSNEAIWSASGEQLCIICQYFPLSRALLPCRHTCVCASCFDKLDKCPMCRGPINSYFCIRSEEYMPLQSTKPEVEHGPFFNWIDGLNERLIDLLGFHR